MDRIIIRELVDRYHAAVNNRDWDLLASVFAADAQWEVLEPVNLRFEGREAIAAGLKASVCGQEMLVQNCAGVVIDLHGETDARIVSTLMEFGREADGGARWAAIGSYRDEVRKEGDCWLFVRRTLHVSYLGAPDLSGEIFADGIMALGFHG